MSRVIRLLIGCMILALSVAVFSLAAAHSAPTSDGDLDLTFGTGGKVTTSFPAGPDQVHGVVRQADGKLVVAGQAGNHSFGLARYTSGGQLDPTFGHNGIQLTSFGGIRDGANAVALQADGKIVAAGMVGDLYSGPPPQFALARYLVDGSLDPTFGVGGLVRTDFPSEGGGAIWALAVQPDGKILAAGQTPGTFSKFALARYRPDGSLDPAFGTGGRVVSTPDLDSIAYTVALQADGKIIAAGMASPVSGSTAQRNFALVRYQADGSLDPGFGAGGVVLTDFAGDWDEARSMILQPDGRIVVAGFATGGTFALARYTTTGSLDPTFGAAGLVITDFGNGSGSEIHSLVLQSNGRIVAAGYAATPPSYGRDFALARYLANGQLDATFGAGGKTMTDLGTTDDEGYGLALQPNGALVAAGTRGLDNTSADFALVRYLPGGSLDPGFGTGGSVTTDTGAGDESAVAVGMQFDGKIVAAGTSQTGQGDFALTRYLPDGSPDLTLGGTGQVTTDLAGGQDIANALLLQPDGKIVVAGTHDFSFWQNFVGGGFALARYRPDGSLDPAFGTAGKVLENGSAVVQALALQPDGKIVAAGISSSLCPRFCRMFFQLGRYNPDGSPDTTFGANGQVTLSFSGLPVFQDRAYAVAIQSDGKIVVAGETNQANIGMELGLARLTPDGSLDPTFGSGGLVVTGIAGAIYSLALQGDGKIVAAGYTGSAGYTVTRYLPGGALDPTFGSGGLATSNLGDRGIARAVLLQQDLKILVAGSAGDAALPTGHGFGLVRYLPDGSRDPAFGAAGILTTPFGLNSGANAVTLQADGKIVAAGGAQPGLTGLDFGVVRYHNAPPLPPTPTPHAGRFQDVPPDQPFYFYIECMGAHNIISGYTCGGPGEPCWPPANKPYFRPGADVTRGQVAKMISSAAAIQDPVPTTQQTFADVPTGNPFWLWIEQLAGRGVVSGYTCGGPGEPCDPQQRPYFRPNTALTRSQLAKIDANTAGYQEPIPTTQQTFADVPPSQPFYVFIERVALHGVLSGYTCGGPGEPCDPQNRPYFRPGNNVTRGQTAKIVTNTFFPNCTTAPPTATPGGATATPAPTETPGGPTATPSPPPPGSPSATATLPPLTPTSTPSARR